MQIEVQEVLGEEVNGSNNSVVSEPWPLQIIAPLGASEQRFSFPYLLLNSASFTL